MSHTVILTDDPVYPSERAQHDPVRRVDRPIADADGNIGVPYFAADLLSRMCERGTITRDMLIAGQEFHDTFRIAHLDELRAADVARPVVSGSRCAVDSARIGYAKRAVSETIRALGGEGSIVASCAWHVLGLEKSLRQWVQEEAHRGRRISKDQATGVLISVLEILAARGA